MNLRSLISASFKCSTTAEFEDLQKAMNATAILPTDRIYPISIPNQPIIDVLPTTLQGLENLQGRALTAVENYYGLEHDGALQVRIGRVRREYGISPLTLTYH